MAEKKMSRSFWPWSFAIPPLFPGNCVITSFSEKVYFSNKAPLLPITTKLKNSLNYLTNKRSSTIAFSGRYIRNIWSLKLNKANDHDNISINTLKKCSDTICKPLYKWYLIKCLYLIRFHLSAKKSVSFVLIHKKRTKKI